MAAAHSYWSASGFESLMLCPGKKVMEAGKPDSTSIYAAEGTAAHQLLTWALTDKADADYYLDTVIKINERGRVIPEGSDELPEWTFTVDEDMARHVQVCIDYVRDVAGADGAVIVDTRVNYSKYLDVDYDTAWGTADVIILKGDEVIVIDFKYGMGVEVQAGWDDINGYDETIRHPNPQMALYALGALAEYEIAGDFSHVRMAISQPRITTKPSEYDLPIEELITWAADEGQAAVIRCNNAAEVHQLTAEEWSAKHLVPGEKQCKFCRAKATCPALRAEVAKSVFAGEAPATPDEFAAAETHGAHDELPYDEPHWLAACLAKADLIEDWVKAVRAEVERRLLAGQEVPGYKLVQGKKGNRKWSDPKVVEELFKTMRLKVEQMYDFTLISPTSAEKLAPKYDKAGKLVPPKEGAPAPIIGPRQWPKVKELITQSEGKPHVAPLSDPREPLVITPVADDFETVAEPSAEDFA